MAAFGSLVALTSDTALLCRNTAESIDSFGAEIGAGPAAFTSTTSECLIAQDALERLRSFLNLNGDTADVTYLPGCFETVVHALNSVLFEIDIELRRLRRYAANGGSQPEEARRMLQDSLFEARSDIRRNRSSLCLLLDCARSGILAEAKVQSGQPSSGEKPAEMSRSQPRLSLSLTKESTRPHIQQQIVRVRPKLTRAFRLESKQNKKLHECISNGDHTGVCKSLSEKADPSAPLKSSKMTPIQRALNQAEDALCCEDVIASRDFILIIMALIVAGADLRCVNEDQQTPLIHAVKSAMGDSLACLMLEYGASVNATDKEQNTALHYAAMQHASAEMSNVDTIRTLLAFGADQNIKNLRGRTAVYKAVMWQHLNQATELLDYGADVEISDNHGWTALYGAVLQGNAPLTTLLCTRGANVDKKDKTGQTALHYAVSQGLQEIVDILVNAGANVNLISKGETPLGRATAKSNARLVRYLISHGADLSVPSPGYNGALPIHIATMGKDTDVLNILIEAGASVNSVDGDGRTPLAWAMEVNKAEMVQLLQSKGALPPS